MNTEATRVLVRRLYDARARGDHDALVALIHPDIDWLLLAPIEVFPFAGSRKGKAAVLDALALLASLFELKRYVSDVIVVDGDRGAVLSNAAFMQRATGRTLSFRTADFLRFEDGLLIEFRELLDSLDVTQQALGRWIEL